MKINDFPPELGKKLVVYSRSVLNSFIKNNKTLNSLKDPPILLEKAGVFCTLRIHGQLRGCIGYPYPTLPLGEALVKATIQAATEDPRFKPVLSEELEKIDLELTVLTPPERIIIKSLEDYFKEIVIGRDGLIIDYKGHRGLLLPQVPVEQGWNIEEYLEGICHKAYLPSDAWKNFQQVKMFKFQGIIYCE